MAVQPPLINGREYAYSDIKLYLYGRLVIGITAIEYGAKKAIDGIYGQGNEMVAWSEGKIEPNASITIQTKEIIALQKSLPKGMNVWDADPADIIVAYGDGVNTEIAIDTIKMAKLTANERKWKVDDKVGETTIPLFTPRIDFYQG